MSLTRRELLKNGLLLAPAGLLWPRTSLASLRAGPTAVPRNLVFVELKGGNDGLNTVVPYGLNGGAYSATYRPTLGVAESDLLKIDDEIGFNPGLVALWDHFDGGRLAVLQGVSYPAPNFSHAFAQRIWATGDPTGGTPTGWFGRLLAQQGNPYPRAFDVNSSLTPLFRGSGGFVPSFKSMKDMSFPIDNRHRNDGPVRESAFRGMLLGLGQASGPLGHMAAEGTHLMAVLDAADTIPEYDNVGAYPDASLATDLALVARLIAAGVDLRYHHVQYGGFDTHASQNTNGYHAGKLAVIAESIAAFHQDLVDIGQSRQTLVIVYSEFGRSIYENGSGGCDHGSVGPVLVFGDGVHGGLATPHPSLDPADLTDENEMAMTTDFRDVFGTLASEWLDVDPAPLFPGHTVRNLRFVR